MDFSRIKTREPAQSKRKRTSHKSYFMREFTRTMPGTKIGTHHLCEPAQSKRTWTCHKKDFMREFTRTIPGTKIGTHHLCEPAQSKCTWASHKKKNAGHQNRDAQFARAYAIKMHLRELQEPPAREFTCKMLATKIGMHMDKSRQVTIATENLKEKCCRPKSRGRLCAQSKCTWTCQKRQFMRESRGKCRKPGGAPLSRTGLRKNPSVWTQCLGNECGIV